MANHSCILSCLGIQWTEQHGALQSMGSQNQTGLNDWAGKRTTPSIWRILLTTRMYSLDWLKLENWWCLKLHLDATNPRIVHEVIMPCSLNTIKLLTTPSRVGHTILRALAYCGPLCQSNKSCSFILHPKLSLCFCSARLNRDRVWQQKHNVYQVLKTTENWQKYILFHYVKKNTMHLNALLRKKSRFPCIHRGRVFLLEWLLMSLLEILFLSTVESHWGFIF